MSLLDFRVERKQSLAFLVGIAKIMSLTALYVLVPGCQTLPSEHFNTGKPLSDCVL